MRKSLLLSALFVCSLLFADQDFRAQYLKLYYDGEYAKAHAILRKAFTDPFEVKVWEHRIHANQQLPPCEFWNPDDLSIHALALLHTGDIDSANSAFKDDTASLLGLATLSLWQNDSSRSRNYVHEGLKRFPDFGEFLFLAGNLAESDEEALDYFRKYLDKKPADQLKAATAEQAIDFVTKTKGVPLNIPTLNSDLESLDSTFQDGRMIAKAQIDGGSSVRLLVDTGAAGLSLEKGNWQPKIVSDLTMIGFGKQQKTKGERAVFTQFSTGGFQLKNPVVAISDSLHGTGIEGIAGAVLFSRYTVILPLKADKKITLFSGSAEDWLKKNAAAYSIHETLPFYSVNKMIVVKGRIKDSSNNMDVLVDTGAYRSVLSAAAAKKYTHVDYPASRAASKKPELFGLGGRVEDLLIADNVEVKIGSMQKGFNRMIAMNLAEISEALELEIDLILGQDFLEGYTLLIDYANNRITFLK